MHLFVSTIKNLYYELQVPAVIIIIVEKNS